ncbi:S41 family peptidase [uncultured Kordia sp.]|uniref:S41 family peptidase n=1 Tax=uncultured Kordia sp. TaxID=507699 RepID=UPI0026383897|nr:S41 family peptidase [uncultured Kordia sp.]
MKHLILFSIILLLVSCASENEEAANNQSDILTQKEMLEDYELFSNIYRNANSGLYKYHTKTEIDSVFSSNRKRITKKFSYRNFYNTLWNVIDYTGSCHNNLHYPDSLDKELSKQKIFFPIPLKYIDDKLYTNIDYKGIPLGSEIISVNNIPVDEFSKRVARYVSTDGFNTTGKYANIETDWLPFYIYLAFGEQNSFNLKYKLKNTENTQDANIRSVAYSAFYRNYKNRFSKTYEERKSKDYSYTYVDSIHTGILEITTFALGGPKSEGHQKYTKFLDSVFNSLQTQNTPNLIVDIRGNGGGNDPNDLLLYSYLTKRTFRENTSAFTLFQKIPNKEYYIDDDIQELAEELEEEHSILKAGKYYQNTTFNKVWNPTKNAFYGNIIVLIDPFVASAGSLFASLLKSDENTILIGEETLGGYYGHTGHIPVTYQLPNSKLELTFSIVDLEQDVKQLSDQQYGDGVKPDIRVVQTYHDFLNHKDTQLHVAIQKLKSY